MHEEGVCPVTDAEHLLPFPGTPEASSDFVGSKGQSLIRMAAAGLNVPPGMILTTAFFMPWVEVMASTAEWRKFQLSSPEERQQACVALTQRAIALPLVDSQTLALRSVSTWIASQSCDGLFAVRSSSPQEDLQNVSFAGGYETRLGVQHDELETAIRACFASAFDERVFAYKVSRGLLLSPPKMAVVVQVQLRSEVAGVAFSINPLTNDFDEAVIDANWGQGQSVVAGLVTPDHWLLNKCSGAIIEQSIHDKKLSYWIDGSAGLVERTDHRRNERCLSDTQLEEVLELVVQLERMFDQPIDIEWAIADEKLHVLQARPVTAFVPLPERLLTPPGKRRRLYMDIALSSGLTMNAPISPMGLDVFRNLACDIGQIAFGIRGALPAGDQALLVLDGGRMYLDLSNLMWLGGPRLLAKKLKMSDALIARTLEHVDTSMYRSARRPAWARLHQLWRIPVAWWRLRRLITNALLPLLAPMRMHRRVKRKLIDFEIMLESHIDTTLPLDVFWKRHVTSLLQPLLEESLAAVGPGVTAVRAYSALAKPVLSEDAEQHERLDRGFEGNVVVAMSLAMMRLAKLLLPEDVHDPKKLEARLHDGQLSAAFLEEWHRFVRQFGVRGPMEMDVAHPRYADAPHIALAQIGAMVSGGSERDLEAASNRQIDGRREAAATAIRLAGPIRRALLRHLHCVIEHYAGLRDTPKHHLLAILRGLRRRLLVEGGRLQAQGRLDSAEHVFYLTLDELLAADSDLALDLKQLYSQRYAANAHLASQVVNFPSLIDSRGRVLKPSQREHFVGDFVGVGLSPGVVVGPARTLRSPHDRSLSKGDILIAYTTDPGWTPIFCNAAAVVLEVGGALQHGAIVARELGLPCVAGIDGISTAIKDGQYVEVDGTSGICRILPR